MKVIQMERQKGKTEKLVKLVKKTNGTLVVFSGHERQRIINKYQLQPHQIVIASEGVLRGLRLPVFVDNADLVLERYLGIPVNVITITKSPKGDK